MILYNNGGYFSAFDILIELKLFGRVFWTRPFFILAYLFVFIPGFTP